MKQKIFDPDNKFSRITCMLKFFDNTENPYSQSGISSASMPEYAVGMGPRILEENKSHDWEELLLMVSKAEDRIAFRHLFNHFALKWWSFQVQVF